MSPVQTVEMRRFAEFDATFPDHHAEMIDGVVYVGEIVSESHPEDDTNKKVKKYAQAVIPYYLIVNPIEGTCLLYSLPEGEHYRASLETDFGKPVPIGEPFDLALDTTALYTY
ncbi:Uma2 family endonuclease [Streptomyces sp. NPDC048197]|uniref:Uma2 family endonuclease n=1 Tax=Streptomyces sp. NPDC048197 TaxID=3365511 RepID=UPI0037169AD9